MCVCVCVCVCMCVCVCVWNVWPYLYQESSQLEVQRFPGPQRTTMNLASGLPKRSWLAEFPTSRPADLVPWALPGFPGFPGPPWGRLGPPWLLATDNELICRSLRECQARGQARARPAWHLSATNSASGASELAQHAEFVGHDSR